MVGPLSGLRVLGFGLVYIFQRKSLPRNAPRGVALIVSYKSLAFLKGGE